MLNSFFMSLGFFVVIPEVAGALVDWNLDTHERARSGCAADSRHAVHPFSPFTNAQQSKMAFIRALALFRIKSFSIVFNLQDNFFRTELQFYFHTICAGMLHCIGNSLLCDA